MSFCFMVAVARLEKVLRGSYHSGAEEGKWKLTQTG